MKQPIFLEPLFQERIWGGSKLSKTYGYQIPSNQTGECWAISAHSNGPSVVRSGELKGRSLAKLWEECPDLFGHFESDRFPLLTKILDANDDLSVQVHPNDEYANEYEYGELGKTECWYIIDCDEDAEMIFGHHAQSKEEFIHMAKQSHWDDLLQRVKIKPGDFFYVPSGTIHALCKGTLVLETQQSSDTTYRVYDYNRRDNEGNLRELHLEKAIEVINVPHKVTKIHPALAQTSGGSITTFVEEDYFTVYKWHVQTTMEFIQDAHFMLGSVIEGEGSLYTEEGEFALQKGDHFILPNELSSFKIKGTVQIIASHPNYKGGQHHDMGSTAKQMANV
ncbi:mannose-6-phosphate isomerase, class I [Priestia aryabhattai]|uniref:mannose-6-phosphate isomerase, class I n=1 Tax=Priestia aryabhattai TaxID=412384 RepID=UPI001ADC8929|nr:mannose-6-phosphate isomerase, class I [Priestia aryabhattai]QTL50594.1 mannose-6-phosphate isomerase, class I [Priestia aryabhattai]